MNFTRVTEQQRNWLVGIALLVVTLGLYWPVTTFPFVIYDDHLYVYNNPHIVHGLSWSGFKWSWTAIVAGNWHPLTLWSHMADCSMYRQVAGGHHLTNLLLHLANVLLLWFLIRRMTGLFWPATLAAALFAWHPLNVESVAWISERKNVLSTFFFLLTLLVWLDYGKKPGPAHYVLALVLFALGLMSKPMLVTLPFVLLLLDYWPLQRVFPAQTSAKSETSLRLLILEKVPFFVLAIADCVITFLIQTHTGAVSSFANIPLTWRLANVSVAYITYLEKTFWPSGLCVFYPFPEKLPVTEAIISLAPLILGTLAAWHWRRKYRWLLFGWLWFLGTLVPVIGLVQIGAHSWADRYAYVPLIGIFLIIGCGLNELCAARPALHVPVVAVCILFLSGCLLVAQRQLSYWQSSVALFSRAVAVNPDDAPAQDLLGKAFNGEGKFADAAEHFAIANCLQPHNNDFQYDLGEASFDAGRFSKAIGPLQSALAQKPDDVVLRNMLGIAFMQSGDTREAKNEFSQAVLGHPDYAKSYFNLGKAFLMEKQPQPAITNFMTALRLQPEWPEALENLGSAYAAAGDFSNAIATAAMALKMAQTNHEQDLAKKISTEIDSYTATRGKHP